MKEFAKLMAVGFAVVSLTVSSAMAQTTQTTPSAPPSAPAAPSAPSDSGLREAPMTDKSFPMPKFIDGPVKDIDSSARTVKVGWLLGLLSTTLEVNDQTRIAVDGEKGSLDMIREGDQVKASYDARDGKNIARAIDVTHPEGSARSRKDAPAMVSTPMDSAAGKSPKAP